MRSLSNPRLRKKMERETSKIIFNILEKEDYLINRQESLSTGYFFTFPRQNLSEISLLSLYLMISRVSFHPTQYLPLHLQLAVMSIWGIIATQVLPSQ